MSDYFIFDDIDTRDYEGILVYFNEVDTTPKRVGEFIQIPNRNGSFFLDGGRYEDAPHTYDIVALSKEYASDLINALASKVGYFRLQDSFNADEFYSAVFNSEIEPKITKERDKLTFKVTFTRKPQRWLTSGEDAVTVADGDTLTNPTLFESSPLLAVEGYGTIEFNGYEIEIDNAVLGNIEISPKGGWTTLDKTVSLDDSLLNNGDEITVGKLSLEIRINAPAISRAGLVTADSNVEFSSQSLVFNPNQAGSHCLTTTVLPSFTFEKGTTETKTDTVTITGTAHSVSFTVTCDISISATSSDITISRTVTISASGVSVTVNPRVSSIASCNGYSTKSILGHPTYIDCDLGEAYRIDGDAITSLNQHIDLGSDLPKLASGVNEITYDNTITELKVTPKWWKV